MHGARARKNGVLPHHLLHRTPSAARDAPVYWLLCCTESPPQVEIFHGAILALQGGMLVTSPPHTTAWAVSDFLLINLTPDTSAPLSSSSTRLRLPLSAQCLLPSTAYGEQKKVWTHVSSYVAVWSGCLCLHDCLDLGLLACTSNSRCLLQQGAPGCMIPETRNAQEAASEALSDIAGHRPHPRAICPHSVQAHPIVRHREAAQCIRREPASALLSLLSVPPGRCLI